jgi:hypothetical protein
MIAAAVRVTMRCDSCAIDRRFYVAGRDHDADELPDDVVEAIALGWSRRHAGHDQIVAVSAADIVDAARVDEPGTAIVIVDQRDDRR